MLSKMCYIFWLKLYHVSYFNLITAWLCKYWNPFYCGIATNLIQIAFPKKELAFVHYGCVALPVSYASLCQRTFVFSSVSVCQSRTAEWTLLLFCTLTFARVCRESALALVVPSSAFPLHGRAPGRFVIEPIPSRQVINPRPSLREKESR